ncbi:MAG: OsmC family protein [Candidatus Marinimicrobia bacterium]|nr:OsmC family protein [Candidatus Neomarinimicrobiota bacterium]
MPVTIQRAKGSTFIGKGPSNHWVVLDTKEELGGSEASCEPMELILIALGGCTAMDVESLTRKMHTPADDFKIEITSERSPEHPKVYTKIHLRLSFWGEKLNENLIKKAIDLSQKKYCSVTAMLGKTAEITNEILINPYRN